MIRFILNNTEIKTTQPAGTLLLDFIRYHQSLTGTKIGCREGDCGACTILVGEIKNGTIIYNTATSCLMPIGNAHAKHIVTVEGVNIDGLNAVQQAFAEEGATQCGFCTPGFIVSLAGYCLSQNTPGYAKAIDSVNGNICRCTGYKSIERAVAKINTLVEKRNSDDAIAFAVANKILPPYFMDIKSRLENMITNDNDQTQSITVGRFLGGGTDLYVQRPEEMVEETIDFLYNRQSLKGITQVGNTCEMGAATTVADIETSSIFQQHFPALQKMIRLVSSTPIRNMATIAGNFTNASPIGDLTIFFLALNAQLMLSDGKQTRQVALRSFYKGYKTLDKKPEEYIEKVFFELPSSSTLFNFEKVSKRTHLDIASVNTAISLNMNDNTISEAFLSAGGVGPVPAYLSAASTFLKGKEIVVELLPELLKIVQQEITPISDARGTEAYKRLLLSQLIKAHFITLFPALPEEKILQVK